jgi:hypothetical protein
MGLRPHIALQDEAIPVRAATRRVLGRRTAGATRRARLGAEGNEILTSAAAAVLTVLLAAEGITIIRMGGLVSVHMFICSSSLRRF